jgi:hypothetical protein
MEQPLGGRMRICTGSSAAIPWAPLRPAFGNRPEAVGIASAQSSCLLSRRLIGPTLWNGERLSGEEVTQRCPGRRESPTTPSTGHVGYPRPIFDVVVVGWVRHEIRTENRATATPFPPDAGWWPARLPPRLRAEWHRQFERAARWNAPDLCPTAECGRAAR